MALTTGLRFGRTDVRPTTTASMGCIHAQLLLVDDPEMEAPYAGVSILAAQDEIDVVELQRAAEQRTPRATIWLLRFRQVPS